MTWEPVAGERIALRTELARESKYFLDLVTFRDALYIATGDQRTGGSEIWRTQDGERWEAVVGAPSPYPAGMGNPNHDMIYDLAIYNGFLFAGVLNSAHQGGALWRTTGKNDGRGWKVVAGDPPALYGPGFGDEANIGIVSLAEFGGSFYAGTTNEQGAQVWQKDESGWKQFVGPGAPTPAGFGKSGNRSVNTLQVFKGHLYAGTDNPQEGAEVWRLDLPGQPPKESAETQ